MVVALKPLHDLGKIKRVIVSSYQSTSGAGKAAMDELFEQTKGIYSNNSIEPEIFQTQISFNVIPQIGPFVSSGYTEEEEKMINETKKIDIDALINDIISKDQTVTFWVADQLGVGEVNGMPIDGGPSFPFAQEGNVVWASGKSLKALEQQLKGDYIFIISGSPTRSKLFNKSVYDIYVSKLGDYGTFKEAAMLTKPVQSIKTVLDSFDSWESLRESPERKTFLNGIADQLLKPNTEFHKYMVSIDGFVNAQDLRDGFYKENDFKQNDIMLVYKYTGTKAGSNHSTYANEVLGEVIGIHIRDDLITKEGLIDVARMRPVGRLGYNDYTELLSLIHI